MGVLLVLVILVSGFSFCHKHPQYFFKLHRYEGQYLYLQAAFLGVFCLIASVILNLILLEIFNTKVCLCLQTLGIDYVNFIASYISKLGFKNIDSVLYAWIIVISGTTLLMPSILTKLIYFYFRKQLKLDTNDDVDVVIMSEMFSDSPLDQLLFSSIINHTNIMIVLDDRKVYVGRVATMGEPNENEGADQEVSFLPLVSGHRDEKTLKITFTTDYKQIGDNLPVVIRQDAIVSAREFDFSVYESFQAT